MYFIKHYQQKCRKNNCDIDCLNSEVSVYIHTWMCEFIVIVDPQLQKWEITKQQCRCQLLTVCIH